MRVVRTTPTNHAEQPQAIPGKVTPIAEVSSTQPTSTPEPISAAVMACYAEHESPANQMCFSPSASIFSDEGLSDSAVSSPISEGDRIALAGPLITAQDEEQSTLSQDVVNAREKVRSLLYTFRPILRADHFQYALTGINQIQSKEEAQRLLSRIVEMAQAQIGADNNAAVLGSYAEALAETLCEVALPPNPKEDPLGFAISLAAYAIPIGKLLQKIPGFEEALAKGLKVSREFLRESLNTALKVPQGLTLSKYKQMSALLRQDLVRINQKFGLNLNLSDVKLMTHGSRAARTASATSDIDVAIRVSPEEFERAVRKLFNNPNPGSAKERTMLHAIRTGKIQRGEIDMRNLGKELASKLGFDVDISIIRIGGPFDRGPYLPLK
ncbi:MAG: hypothetical protein ACAI44_21665 [Candidatus Sericytochromatia bacterium]